MSLEHMQASRESAQGDEGQEAASSGVSAVAIALGSALMKETEIEAEYSILTPDSEGEAVPTRFMTDFIVYHHQTGPISIDSIEPNMPVRCKGTLVKFNFERDYRAVDILSYEEVEKSPQRVDVGPVTDRAHEYFDDYTVLWLRTKDAWYGLLEPATPYKENYMEYWKKVSLTHGVYNALQANPAVTLLELAQLGSINFHDLAQNGLFVSRELQLFAAYAQLPLLRKAIPQLARKYAAQTATQRRGITRLRQNNMLIAQEVIAVRERTLAFFGQHWPVIEPFAKGIPKKILDKLLMYKAKGHPDMMEDEDYEATMELLHIQPDFVNFGTMRAYQLDGLRWMVDKFARGLRGMILADEMGLGKTLQAITFIGYIKFIAKQDGPFLVLAPLSCLPNWMNEFERWCPDLTVVKFHGNREQRDILRRDVMQAGKFDVCVTNYESVRSEEKTITKFTWRALVMDEAHRIKNENAMQTQLCQRIRAQHILLLTGTPLQNNLHELWVLLRFLFPDIFPSSEAFDKAFDLTKNQVDQAILSKAHALLQPFFLRRCKTDVELSLPDKVETNIYLPLSPLQTSCYRGLLTGEIGAVLADDSQAASQAALKKLMMLVIQLRKACNHPYLFDGMEPEPFVPGEHLIKASSKLVFLDKFLPRLQDEGHRVLLYSQFTSMLDILEDYCSMRNWVYVRLDGSTHSVERQLNVDRFNAEGSDVFIFLLSTRAGGLGINLQTADTVILYDSDWNPQADLQAMDRAHRIGQKNDVNVYRLITEGTVEERILQRATQKLFLDAMVVGQAYQATQQQEGKKSMSTSELLSIIKFGAQRVLTTAGTDITDADVDVLLSRSKEYAEQQKTGLQREESNLQEVEQNAAEFDWAKMAPRAISNFQGEDLADESKKKHDSSIDRILDEVRATGGRRTRKKRTVTMQVEGLGEVQVSTSSLEQQRLNAEEEAGAKAPKAVRHRKWQHETACFVCADELEEEGEHEEQNEEDEDEDNRKRKKRSKTVTGDGIKCSACPKVYHLKCLGYDEAPSTFPPWRCPWHRCSVCNTSSANAGNILFRCQTCPTSYCNACRPSDLKMIGRSKVEGYKSGSALYVTCQKCDAANK